MRVTKIGQVVQINGADWVDLEGQELRPDGSQASDRVRHAVVRRTGLRNPPGQLEDGHQPGGRWVRRAYGDAG